ncbi:chromate transporter [Mycoplasma testudineum]|nr:chromate transporter [Mycoplasma testudineum]
MQTILFLQIVTFLGFGGGNALMPIMKRYSVEKYKWITEEQFDRGVVVTNMLPGPAVIQMLTYLLSTRIGKGWAIIVVTIGILPHVLLAVLLYWLFQFLPSKYIFTINIGVLSAILVTLIFFAIQYLKASHKELNLPVWIGLFIFTLAFCLFVPTPYNIPALVMIAVILIVFLYQFIKIKKQKNKEIQ